MMSLNLSSTRKNVFPNGGTLRRQIDSGLFLRLAISKNKQGVLALTKKGQIIEKLRDAVKNTYVLEFLDLPVKKRYPDAFLECHLIANMQKFLLELGKSFIYRGVVSPEYR